MVEKSGSEAAGQSKRVEILAVALDSACGVLTEGDAAQAERIAKAVAALILAEKALSEWQAAAPAQDDDAESRRAEIRRRLIRIVESSHAGGSIEELQRIATEGHAG